jgi:hypothetical protein
MAAKGSKKSGKSVKSVKSVKALPVKHVNESQAGKVRGGRDAASGLPTGQRMHKPITI